jgi:hypothetical protein
MFTWLSVFKSSFEFGKQRLAQPEIRREKYETLTAPSIAKAVQDAEQEFLITIAQLPPAERDKRLQTYRWYVSLAQRQGIAEAEWRMEQYRVSGDERYRF